MFTTSTSALAVIIITFASPLWAGDCKILPSDPKWPSVADWKALNASVSGKLTVPEPAGAVCHPDQKVYDETSCEQVQAQWTNSSWHASNPWSSDYNDDTCLPDPAQPCSARGYPAYVIEAEGVTDVQAAVRFTTRTGVRLAVKGTGHDYLGRSSSPNSLSIWTHRIRGVEINRNDTRAIEYGGVASVKVGAGMRWGEVYAEVLKHNLTVIGGSEHNVGIGGLITAGGHGPVSAYYGFPADNVLEMEVVTADEQHRVINAESDSDLFWAMRGGGAGFGILVSATLKAYPQLAGVRYDFGLNTTANSDTFWSLSTYFHTHLPAISDAGGMGYPIYFANLSQMIPGNDIGQVTGTFIFPERTTDQVHAVMDPLVTGLNDSDWAIDPVYGSGNSQEFESHLADWLQRSSSDMDVGTTTRLGSWLLDRDALTGDFEGIRAQLRKASSSFPILDQIVTGPGVRSVLVPGGGNAVLPAWRKAIVHIGVYITCPNFPPHPKRVPAKWKTDIGNNNKSFRVPGRRTTQQSKPR